MDFFPGFLVILYITTLINGNTEITTMFQDIKIFRYVSGSWDLAENLCQENGYRLLTMKNKSKREAIKQYVIKNGISTSTGFWLGMTEVPIGSSNWFWSDASQVQSESLLWKTGYPTPTVGECVKINTFDASYEWQNEACSATDHRIVCEKDMSGSCTYSDHIIPFFCPRSNFSYWKERVTDSASSLAECQQKCSQFQNNDYECWSLTFKATTCVLYCYDSPFLLSQILPLFDFAELCFSTHFQHKTCFSATLDSRTLAATTSTAATSVTLTTTTQSTTNVTSSANITTTLVTVTTTAEPTTHIPTSATVEVPTMTSSFTTTNELTSDLSATEVVSYSTTNKPTNVTSSANITTTLVTVTTTAEPTTHIPTSATVEVPTMTSSFTTEMTSGSSTTTNELTSDSSTTEVVSYSTTNKPTPSGVINSRPKPLYLYPCPVTRCFKTSSNETLAQSIQRLTQELTISPNTTSAARRKLTCAEDTRSSATAVGVVGVIILSVIGLLVVIPDVMSFVIHLKSCLSRKE